MPWTSLAPAIHRYEALRNAEPRSRAAEVAKAQLNKLLAATPVLRGLLPRLHVRAGSGEYQLLSWYFARERLPIIKPQGGCRLQAAGELGKIKRLSTQ